MTADPRWPSAGIWLTEEAPEPEVLVVGVPSSRASIGSSRADLAPLEVRQRLDRFSTFHGELRVDFGSVPVRDMGNWAVSEMAMAPMVDEVMRLARALPPANLNLYIGGDNAITRPLVAAQATDLADVGLIVFDAHHDVRSLNEGPTNRTPIRGLIEQHGLRGRNVVQIGSHSFANSAHYRNYCDEVGITVVTVEQVERIGLKAAVDVALSQLSAICETIYVNVDVAVLDRAFAPACAGARPGGLTVRQLAQGVALCAAHPAVVAMDFVEVDPTADVGHQTLDVLAHALLISVAGYASRALSPR
jgi:formiminoglutamase